MNLNILNELAIFFALLSIAIGAAVAKSLMNAVTAHCGKLSAAFWDALFGFVYCMAVFLVIFLLDDGRIRVVYPLLAAVELYVMLKAIEKIKKVARQRKKKILDIKAENKIK